MATFDVNAVTRKVQATGNGTAGPVSFSFQVNATSDLAVYVDTTKKTLTSHYTVSLNTNGTGSVSFTSGNYPTSSQTITIIGEVPFSRTSVYTSGGNITAASLESDLDTNIMLHAQHDEKFSRALMAPISDPSSLSFEFPAKASRLGKVLGFNSSSGAPEAFTYVTTDAADALASITAGTVAASKFLQVDANRDLSTIRNLTSDGTITASSFVIGSAAINENDLEALDDVTAGSISASKAAIVDTNKDITGFRNITLTGELDSATLDVSGDANIAGEVQTTKIAFTDGDDAMTITDTGLVEFNTGFNVGSDASGDILYNNGTKYVRLAKGTDGQTLTLASGVPSWATNAGDIAGVTAGTGLSGGGSSGTVTVNLDTHSLTEAAIANGDYIIFNDATDSNAPKREALADVATLFSGTGLTASSSVINIDAAQTGITSLLATDIKIGEDDQTKIDFETANQIHFYADNTKRVTIDSTGLTVNSGSIETATIDYTDGDNSMTIADGGKVTFASGFDVGSDASGDILYHNGTSYVRLAKGSDGEVLKLASGVPSWASVSAGSSAADDIGTGDAAVTIATSAGNITFDAQGNNTDIIFKGTDDSADTTFLTLDGSEAGAATFNGKITSDAGIDIDNINIDGTQINLSSGDLTISAAGDLIFSTSGRDTTFSYAGTPEANIHTGTGSTVISTLVSDRNLDFAGNDGGSTVTVCSFDMSENGFATFRTAAVFNEEGLDADFRVESDGQAHMLFVDADVNTVLINNSSRNGSEQFHVTGLCYIDTTQGTGYNAASNSGSIVIGATNWSAVNANAVVQQRIYGGGDANGQRISIKYRTRSSDSLGSEVDGAYCTGTAWTDSSDIAYKDNIVNIPYGLETIQKLIPRKWKWNTTLKDDIGFVAQEIEKEIPEVVTGKDGEKGLHYGSLVAVCVKAIQELEARIKVLEGK